MKIGRLVKLMYKKFRIDFSGVHTSNPSYLNKTSHLILKLYKFRFKKFKRDRRKPRFIHKFYRQFIYKYIYRVDINKPKKRRKKYKWWFVSRRWHVYFI